MGLNGLFGRSSEQQAPTVVMGTGNIFGALAQRDNQACETSKHAQFKEQLARYNEAREMFSDASLSGVKGHALETLQNELNIARSALNRAESKYIAAKENSKSIVIHSTSTTPKLKRLATPRVRVPLQELNQKGDVKDFEASYDCTTK